MYVCDIIIVEIVYYMQFGIFDVICIYIYMYCIYFFMYICIFDFDIGCFNISEMYMFLYEVLIWVLELKWKFSCYYIFL